MKDILLMLEQQLREKERQAVSKADQNVLNSTQMPSIGLLRSKQKRTIRSL